MPTLLEILNDPNYVDANPATKAAIFNKYAPEDPNYAGANAATQAAIREKFGLGQEDKLARLQRERAAMEAEPTKPETTTWGSAKELVKGLVPGAVGLAEQAGTGIAAMLPEESEKQLRSYIKGAAEKIKKPFEAAPGYEDSMARKLSEGLGSTIPFFALGPLGAVGRAAGVGIGAAAGAGEARERAEAGGATGGERRAATLLGIGPGLLDVLAPEVAQRAVGIVKRALISGGVEGATEAAQNISQNLIEKGLYNPEAGILTGAGEAAGYGAGTGALASMLVDVVLGRKARGGRGKRPEEVTPEESTTAQPATEVTPPVSEAAPKEVTTTIAEAPATTEPAVPATVSPEDLAAVTGEAAPELTLTGEEAVAEPTVRKGKKGKAEAKPKRELEQVATVEEAFGFPAPEIATETKAEPLTLKEPKREVPRAATVEEAFGLPATPKTDAEIAALEQAGLTPAEAAPEVPGITPTEPGQVSEVAMVEPVQELTPEVPEITPVQEVTTKKPKSRTARKTEAPAVEEVTTEGIAPVQPELEEVVSEPAEPPAVGVTPTVEPSPVETEAESAIAGTEPTRVGVSPEGVVADSGERGAAAISPAGIEAPQPTGLGAAERIPDVLGGGTGAKRSPLAKISKLEPKIKVPAKRKAAPKAEAKPEPKSEPKPEPKVKSKEAPKKAKPAKKGTAAEDATERYMTAAKGSKKDALRYLAGDIYYASKPDAKTGEYKKLLFGTPDELVPGLGGRFGKAFYNSLSETDKSAVMKEVARMHEQERRGNVELARLNAMQEMDAALQESIEEGDEKFIRPDAVVLGMPLHPQVEDLLRDGDLQGAMDMLASMLPGKPGQVAAKLAEVVGSVNIKVVKDLKGADGYARPGLFDVKTRTIKLDQDAGLNVHVLLHEMTHAATVESLANKNAATTKQLQKIYDDVKDTLDTYYGTESLDEFVAEAFSNPDFQAKLREINMRGEPASLWDRFSAAVRSIVRRMMGLGSVSPTSTFDRVDALVSQILYTSPGTRNSGVIYQLSAQGKGDTVFDAVCDKLESLPGVSPALVDKFHEFFAGTAKGGIKNAVRASLPLNALVDVAEKYLPSSRKVDDMVNRKSGEESRRMDALHRNMMAAGDWKMKATPKQLESFNNVVYDSTVAQVDPSKPESAYKDDPEKLAQWKEMQADWQAIGTSGREIYNMMRDTYKKMYFDIEKMLGERIEEALVDKVTSSKVKSEILKKLADKKGLDPYFPLTRRGGHWLSYNAYNPRTDTTERYVEAFESARARDRAIEELSKDKTVKNIEKFHNFKDSYRSLPPTSFANSVLRTLESNNVDSTTIEEVMRLFLDTLPESSFAQAFRKRRNVLGFERDAFEAYRTKTYNISRQITNLEYGAKFAALKRNISEEAEGGDAEVRGYADELNKRIDFAISPNISAWSKRLTSGAFFMTLGFNVSSAVVNLTQVPLVVTPYLGGKYGFSETTKAIGKAYRLYATSGATRDLEPYVTLPSGYKTKVPSMVSLDNIDFKAAKNKDLAHYAELVDVGRELGQFNRSQVYDILDVNPDDPMQTKINAASGWVFHQGERLNRQVSMIAAYDLELAKMKKDGRTIDEAARREAAYEAVKVTELTNGGVSAAAAPRIAQNSITKVMFMYKRYGISMYYMLFKTARDMLKHEDPAVRKAAKKQIAGIYLSAGLMAGVKGVPLYGVAALIFNMFRDDDEDKADELMRKWMGELPFRGVLNAVTGTEIGGRIGLGDLIFRDQGYNKQDQTTAQQLMQWAGGPALGVADRFERGAKLFMEGDAMRGMEQMLPSSIGNALKAYRYATEGTKTLRGDPITGEVSPAQVGAQLLGFAPADYIRQLEENAALKRIQRTIGEDKTKILGRFYRALMEGDNSELDDVFKELDKYNGKYPENAITADTLEKSMKSHMQTTALMHHGVSIDKNLYARLMQNASEYQTGISLFD